MRYYQALGLSTNASEATPDIVRWQIYTSAAQRITPSGARRSHDAPNLSGLGGRRQPLDRDGSNSRLVRVHALLGHKTMARPRGVVIVHPGGVTSFFHKEGPNGERGFQLFSSMVPCHVENGRPLLRS
jgi:hypothetical protein